MKDVLDEIVAWKRIEVAQFKEQVAPRVLYNKVERMLDTSVPSMKAALMSSKSGIIAEFKRKSPSKGWINEDAKPDTVPLEYQKNGAAALSILTDEKYFGGADSFVTAARKSGVEIPVLYKNFVIDEYQLFQARLCGASAVLLIAADLTKKECGSLLGIARELGLEVLLEMHNDRDFEYAELEPDMYGINNRNLGTFVTDVQNSFRLAEQLPEGVCKVSESGIGNPETVRMLRLAGFNGFLIGESFMKTAAPGEALKAFVDKLETTD